MKQRILALVLILLCAGLAIAAWQYEAAYSYEPVGPRAFPLLLIGLLAAGALYLLLQPVESSGTSERVDVGMVVSVCLCVVMLTIYATLFEVAGFLISSTLFAVCFARLYGGTWRNSSLVGVVIAVSLYVLFEKVLDVPLPVGLLSFLEN